ncbi:C2 NT-type domain-containing protein [Haematococcus lacustris]|uniref:C2 NT-type domain-containing protein n=1 Tax=Haematococcus lacustris TaxID=44745 RepID=A0A699Z7H1_HAELA|nr:C2 NT-type domain-containing protein [Haematococcus lacustris]
MRKAERQISRLVRDNESLSSQLKAEAALRERLEGQVVRGLENMGDDEAIEAVEAFEEKYKRLRERYRAGSSREALERENQALVVQLVNKQLEAAQLAEDQAMLRRELYRVKEVNMKLATKMTTLEAQAYSSRDSKKKGGKGAGNKSNGSDKE